MFNRQEWYGPPLPYPTRPVTAGGEAVEEYIIPEGDKAGVLERLYPFDPVPSLDDMMYDLHEEKVFRVGDFRVIRGPVMDMLVSPYYFRSGGTVIDWMPPDFEPGGFLSRRIRGQEGSLMTLSFGPKPRAH